MKTALVKTYFNSVSAHLARTKLESENIHCFLVNENATSQFPNYFGIMGLGLEVRVNERDIVEASKLLETPSIKSCENCGSSHIEWKSKGSILNTLLLVLSMIILIPIGNLFAWECRKCGTRFN